MIGSIIKESKWVNEGKGTLPYRIVLKQQTKCSYSTHIIDNEGNSYYGHYDMSYSDAQTDFCKRVRETEGRNRNV